MVEFTGPTTMTVGNNICWVDHRGAYVPEEVIPPIEKLEDQLVRKIMGYAEDLSAQVARFKGHSFDDVGSFMDLLAEKYGAKRGGKEGNVSFSTYDGSMRLELRMHKRLSFGPELQIARDLFDECLREWSSEANPALRAIVEQAFQVDTEGRIDMAALFRLRNIVVEDARWKRGQEAIGGAIVVEGAKAAIYFKKRRDDGSYVSVTVNIAKA